MKCLWLLAFLLLPMQVSAQSISAGSSGLTNLFNTSASVGNGADTTEDTLQTFVVPAGQLANVGDRLVIELGGTLGATTDNKTVRVKLNGGASIGTITVSAAAQVFWVSHIVVMKTGASTQSTIALAGASNIVAALNGLQTVTDTATITITVTGQNITNSVAGSIVCRYMTVDYQHG